MRRWLLSILAFGVISSDIEAVYQPPVNQAPGFSILEQPKDVSILVGTNASFYVSVGSFGQFAMYQWFENGVAISGATQSNYVTQIQTSPSQKVYTVAVHVPNPYLGEPVDPNQGKPILGLLSEPAVLTVFSSPPNGGLLAYWSFDEEFTTNVLDRAGQYNGRVINGARVPGAIGSGALQLNGRDAYMFVGAVRTPLQLASTPYTLSWWQRWDGPTTTHQDIISMDEGADYSGGYQVYLEPASGQMSHVHANTRETVWQGMAVTDRIWRHYAITFNGTVRRLYVDGTLAASRPTVGGLNSDQDDPLLIGALSLQNGTVVNFFNGSLDEVRIYARALEEAEIATLGPQPEIVIARQPVGYRVGQGDVARLSIDASTRATSAPLQYQWELNRVAIPGATNASISVTGTTGTRNYRVLLRTGDLQKYSDEVAITTVPEPAARLLLHLEFEGTTNGVFADSARNFGGIEGNAQLAPGRIGTSSVNIAGNAMIRVPAAGTDLELVGSTYTIAWWFKPSSIGSGDIFTLGQPLNGETGYGARLEGVSSFPRSVRMEHRNRQDQPITSVLRSGTNWVHMTMVYNGVSRILYTNGVATGTALPTAYAVVGSGRDDLFIGWTNGTRSIGWIDDFRVYNYALASDEIGALASVPQPAVQFHLSIAPASAGRAVISWPISSESHRLEFSDLLSNPTNWTPLSSPIESTNFSYHVLQPIEGRIRFFRLRKL